MKKISKIIFNKLFLIFTKVIGKPQLYFKRVGIKVGSNCRIYTSSFGSEPFLITIGNHVTVTSGVSFITHDGSGWLMRDDKGRRYVYQPINIGNHVFIGVNSIIMPGVKIDDEVIVAAGSVVTKSIPSGVVVAGVPAKIIGKYSDIKNKMLDNYISDIDMRALKGTYEERIRKVTTNTYKAYLNDK
ncbi:acyltransferase [Daejeonella oryzae]|uniref:acyltransferase n=1 Tax=Daejeonella oryzae TaxID=1122943 RepID=UPI00056BD6DC|nr:acyltransferase [Daejeonella oryzae]